MKHALFFCLTIAVTAAGRDRTAVSPTEPAPGVRYTSRNLVFGVADTTLVPNESPLHEDAPAGQPLPAFETTVTDAPKALGSGVIVARAGYVLTAAHVIEGGARIEVVTTQGKLPATRVATDRDTDLALLKLPDNTYPALALAPYWTVRVGRRVAAIGFPRPDLQHIQPRLLRGEITAAKDEWGNAGHWKLDFAIEAGGSGAPVIDEAGFVVGIVQRSVMAWPAQRPEGPAAVTTTAVKSGYAWPLLEYADPAPPLVPPVPGDRAFADVVADAGPAVVLVLSYAADSRPEHP